MAYLTLKKEYHTNKPIVLKLLENPDSITGLAKSFKGKTFLEFSIEVENIGQNYPTQGVDSYKINAGQKVDFKMSETLYQKIRDYQQDELVWINAKSTKKGGIFWEIKPAIAEDIEKINQNNGVKDYNDSKKSFNDNRKDDIRWGMAFNNTTRLVSQTTTSTNQKDMVDEIKRLIPYMFQIACGMEKTVEFINNGFKKPSSDSTEIPEQSKEQTLEELEDDLFGGSGGI